MIVDNQKYKGGVYNGFTTAVPGVYEITYTARYMYYKDEFSAGEEMVAAPIKLTIVVESTPPIVESIQKAQSNHLVMAMVTVLGFLCVGAFMFVSKKRRTK